MIAFKYFLFSLLATGINLLFQFFSFEVYNAVGSLYVAMIIGTIAGLICKYILDKKFIFYHTPKDKTDDAKKFFLYTLMGGFTTVIFWGTEMTFDYCFTSQYAKYAGGALGLSIGYIIKYHLDKKYVFTDKTV